MWAVEDEGRLHGGHLKGIRYTVTGVLEGKEEEEKGGTAGRESTSAKTHQGRLPGDRSCVPGHRK